MRSPVNLWHDGLVRALVAEDDPVTGRLIEKLLSKAAYSVVVAPNGVAALEQLRTSPFDVLLTDWMMPDMDGIELLRRVRAEVRPTPLILMITAITVPDARRYALQSGADGFVTKPIVAVELLESIRNIQARTKQEVARSPAQSVAPPSVIAQFRTETASRTVPPFGAIVIGASTGGPEAVRTVLRSLDVRGEAVGFIVVHGPDWMQRQCAELYQKDLRGLTVAVAEDKMLAKAGHVYIAPGDRHLIVEPGTFRLRLLDDAPVNFVRPAIDPLFQSVAAAFGPHCVGVILTGLGCDGADGVASISAAGGKVLIEDPFTAVAPYMPRAALAAVGSKGELAPLAALGPLLSRKFNSINEQRESSRRAAGTG